MTTNTNNHSDKFGSLNNLHLAFVGDSLTRHQHLSLVHYLKWGHWNSHPGYIEGGYSTRFEHRTNISKTLNHSQACNCNRPEGNYLARKKLHLIYFNMYFRDDIRNNYVSLISKNGAAEAHGHWDPQTLFRPDIHANHTLQNYWPVGRGDQVPP